MADNYALIKRYAMSEEIINIFKGIVGDEKAESYIYSVIVAVSASPQLQQCTPQSIMRSAARAASLGLSCDPSLKQAHLVPYKDEATLIPGWRGVRDMAYRTGKVAVINVDFLGEGQRWVQDQLTGKAHIEGLPESNKAIGYFAYLRTLSGREHSVYMTVDEINEHKKKYSAGYNRQQSAWNTDFHKMAMKTVLLQLLYRWAELDAVGFNVASLDYAADGIDDMPDPDAVTITEREPRPNNEILAELGFDEGEAVVKATPVKKPAKKRSSKPDDTPPGATEAPESVNELYKWATTGNIPYVGVKDAKSAVEQSNGELDIAWEVIVALSRERSGNQEKLL
jgi:recombination protein RecT